MRRSDTTRWTLLRGAAGGDPSARDTFALKYLPVVRSYLRARWGGGIHATAVDDAVQDVFLECFRDGGALQRVQPREGSRFRTYLYAVVRNVARRHEERAGKDRARRAALEKEAATTAPRGGSPSREFDRAWAAALVGRAVDRMTAKAARAGPRARRRVELLGLRFAEDLPIREIARRWRIAPERVHREYAVARREFQEALREEIADDLDGSPGDVARECRVVLELLA